DSVEELHHVVEGAALRDAEIVEPNRMCRLEARRHLRFALEAAQRNVVEPLRAAVRLTADELYGRRTREELMTRAPHFAHSALRDLALELVHAHLPFAAGAHGAKRDEVREHPSEQGLPERRQDPRCPRRTGEGPKPAQENG